MYATQATARQRSNLLKSLSGEAEPYERNAYAQRDTAPAISYKQGPLSLFINKTVAQLGR